MTVGCDGVNETTVIDAEHHAVIQKRPQTAVEPFDYNGIDVSGESGDIGGRRVSLRFRQASQAVMP